MLVFRKQHIDTCIDMKAKMKTIVILNSRKDYFLSFTIMLTGPHSSRTVYDSELML